MWGFYNSTGVVSGGRLLPQHCRDGALNMPVKRLFPQRGVGLHAKKLARGIFPFIGGVRRPTNIEQGGNDRLDRAVNVKPFLFRLVLLDALPRFRSYFGYGFAGLRVREPKAKESINVVKPVLD